MTLDIVTLMVVGSLVAALSALVLGGAWILIRERALLWWAAATGFSSLAILSLIYGVLTVAPQVIAFGGAVVAFGTALIWAGARDFAHRPVSLPGLVAGTAVILVLTALDPLGTPYLSARLGGFVASVAYLAAAALELWYNGKEPLRARWPLMFLFALHALVFIGGIADGAGGRLSFLGIALTLDSWFGLIHIESLVFWMGTAIFMIVLCKERSELRLTRAAGFDALTGAMARAAFLSQAERLFARARKAGGPLTLILVDLDRFKTINDTFGHSAGDRVLALFADSARACLRPTDLFGRQGGEEFAILLPGAAMADGMLVAERIRLGFIEACREADGGVAATLSAGIAELGEEESFASLFDKTDQALYRAKNLGRNRIEPAETARPVMKVAWPPQAAAG